MDAQSTGTLPVNERLKLWEKNAPKTAFGSPSTSSVDSGNTNVQERLADFDGDSTGSDTAEDDQGVAGGPSSSATGVCTEVFVSVVVVVVVSLVVVV